ncbi:MAG: 23S rRNA (uracil(1939)-C(5))-methyltransferase RlmD, partial [Elusimicrobiota bacterium]|nr:23S rRNA (uracil(1939)-C(5))-methyltransferase RlmD [Elusimicrobiota bacterium]
MSLKNQTIIVDAQKIVFPGRSLCRCSDGIALFTEGLLPMEKASVLVTRDKKSFREGIVKEIVEKSSERIEPACNLFGKCGGCAFQNTSYENQIKYKNEYVCELLNFLNIPISPTLKNPDIWHYRNKMEFSFFENDGKADLGLHCKGSFNRYVSVSNCLICDKSFMQAANIIRDFAQKENLSAHNNKTHIGFLRHLVLRKAQNNNQMLINIVTMPASDILPSGEKIMRTLADKLKDLADSIHWTQNGKLSDAVIVDNIDLLSGAENIREKLTIDGKDYFFNISPFSFFQTNSKGTQALYNAVLSFLSPDKSDVLLDLYCGTGTISISMSANVKKVIGIEMNAQAVEDAKANAALNNADNVEFYAASAQDWVKETKEKFSCIVLDPPRNGLTNEVIKFLLENEPKKIVYVSCNPST